MSTGTTIAAVIVTFNRCDKLKNVIDALLAQTTLPDRIFVVNNASTDNTAEYLDGLNEPRVEHVRLPENIGGAGGFYEGSKRAYEYGADYVWLSDDDAYPKPDALEILVHSIRDYEERFNRRPPFACSMVRWTNGDMCEMNTPQPVWDYPRNYSAETPYLRVKSCSFVSVLVPRWAFTDHGFPIKDYFIWYDDAEFTARITKTYPGIFCPDSQVIHDIPENKGVNYGLINEGNIWKFRFGARNETSYRRRDQGWFSVLVFARGVRNQMRQHNVPTPLRRQIYKQIIKGAFFFKPPVEKP